MTLRKVILYTHLSLGLAGAIFLVILGLTGSIMAFESDIDHWLHPSRSYVDAVGKPLSANDLISIVRNHYPRIPVFIVEFPRAPNLVAVMQLIDGTTVYVNPYDGSIQGDSIGVQSSDRMLGYIHQMHLRLVPDPGSAPGLAAAGKIIVSIAGVILLLMVPTGVTLWWREKRSSIDWKGTWYKAFFDVHRAAGIYAALFLFIASATGILIGFDAGEKIFYAITGSAAPAPPRLAASTPVPGATPIMADQTLDIARQAIPNATPSILVRPVRPAGAYTVMMRLPGEPPGNAHAAVTIDQYSGRVLHVRNYFAESAGYRLIRFNRSVHTGDIFGLPGHILMSLSSLMLVVMVITGVVIWWKKLVV